MIPRVGTHSTDIPAEAREIPEKGATRYVLGAEEVGWRQFYDDGALMLEVPLRAGRTHGRLWRFYENGVAEWCAPHVDGLEHGTSRQWAPDGHMVGTYRLRRGTGWNLWWGPLGLAEARWLRGGLPDGDEWWFWGGTRSLAVARTWRSGRLHGIEYEWNRAGGIKRGFPRYWLDGVRVTRRAWTRADKTPDPGRGRSDGHTFPAAVERALPPRPAS